MRKIEGCFEEIRGKIPGTNSVDNFHSRGGGDDSLIKFGYEKQESSLFGVIFRPVAEIHLKKKGEEKWYRISTIIDSGADVTLLPGMYAGILGVDLKECKKQKTRGIGGFADVYITEMEVRIGSEEMRTFVGFIEGGYSSSGGKD